MKSYIDTLILEGRPRDRGTENERQWDRETERQRDRETEEQRDREAEIMWNNSSESINFN